MKENLTKSNIHGWTPNSFYEDLSRMKAEDPTRFNKSISAITARCLDLYEQAKRKAQQDDEQAA